MRFLANFFAILFAALSLHAEEMRPKVYCPLLSLT